MTNEEALLREFLSHHGNGTEKARLARWIDTVCMQKRAEGYAQAREQAAGVCESVAKNCGDKVLALNIARHIRAMQPEEKP